MTLQEKELLSRFLQQLAAAQATQKDAEADTLIKEASARQPDAPYLLVQRTIQLEQLLQASQGEVQKLQTELNQTRSGSQGGFLNNSYAWGSRPAATPAENPGGQRAPAAASAAPAATAAAPAQARPGGSWGSGLFGNIASTAAGVVAGSFLFQGIQGLMNRGETSGSDSFAQDHPKQAQADEPELLNSYDTAEADAGDTFVADADDGGDFA